MSTTATAEQFRQTAEQVRQQGIQEVTTRLDECRKLDGEYAEMKAAAAARLAPFGLTIDLDALVAATPNTAAATVGTAMDTPPTPGGKTGLSINRLAEFAQGVKKEGFTGVELVTWAGIHGHLPPNPGEADRKAVMSVLAQAVKGGVVVRTNRSRTDLPVYVHKDFA